MDHDAVGQYSAIGPILRIQIIKGYCWPKSYLHWPLTSRSFYTYRYQCTWVRRASTAAPCSAGPRFSDLLRVPSGNIPKTRPFFKIVNACLKALRSGESRLTGKAPIVLKTQLTTGLTNSSCLAIKHTGRGQATPSAGGSKLLTWLATTITGPLAGTYSRPSTFKPLNKLRYIRTIMAIIE